MKITYTKHAESQLLERNIPKSMVEKILLQPDETLAEEDTLIDHKLLVVDNRTVLIRVFYTQEDDEKRVVTAYLTGKISKYYGKGLK